MSAPVQAHGTYPPVTALKKPGPKHRARPTLVTRLRERERAAEIAGWSRAGRVHPTHRGRHAADTADTVQAVTR